MKKNTKKLLSLTLSLCLFISIFMPALSVSALEDELSLAEKIHAFNGKVDVAEPEAGVAAEFNALIDSYAALTAEEKADFDLMALSKLIQLLTNHLSKVKKAEDPSATIYVQYEYAHAKMLERLSPPAYVEQAAELRLKLEDKTTTSAEKLAEFAASNKEARILLGGYYPAYKAFYYKADQYPTKAIELIITQYATESLAATPNPDVKPARPSKPQPRNYAEGENDPQYIADLAAWLVTEEIYQIWYTSDQNYRIAFEFEILDEIVELAPEYADFLNVVLQMKEAKTIYDQGGDAKDLAIAALEEYNALSDLSKLFIEKYTKYIYYIPVDKGTSWTFTYHKPSTFVKACEDIVNEELLFNFIDLINEAQAPYTRADIVNAKAAYAKVPSSLVASIPPETLLKYQSILASIAPDEPSTDPLDLTGKPKTKVKYPASKGKAGVQDIYETLGSLITDILDLAALLSESLYTNDMVGTIVTAIYPALGKESSLIAQGPSNLAATLNEDKFEGARDKLEAAVSEYNEAGVAIKNLDDWDNVKFESGDWGFEDGDREGFLDAASASFRALSVLTFAIKFENVISTTSGTYTYHAYEDLIPVLEALDLRGVISSPDYTAYVGEETNGHKKMDRRVRPILEPIANLLDDIAADPLNGILNLLPKFAMLLNTGILNDQINKIISGISLVSIDPPDLTTEGFFGLIAPSLDGIEIKAAETDEEDNVIKPAVTLNLKLSEEKFVNLISDLEGCGTYSMHDSVRRGFAYFAGIDSDKADTFVVLYDWLHSEIAARDNTTALIKAISAMDLGTFETLAIQVLLMAFQNIPGMTSLNLLTLLMPLAKFILKFASIFESIGGIGF